MKTALTPFTGTQDGVNHAGKTLGALCLFVPGLTLARAGGDATSLAGLVRKIQGQLGNLSPLFVLILITSLVFFSEDLWAHDGELLKDEIEKVEKLFTGGYMRIGLLGVCAFAAIYGIVKQSGWIFTSGILGCVFAYFMKDWILKTFTMVV